MWNRLAHTSITCIMLFGISLFVIIENVHVDFEHVTWKRLTMHIMSTRRTSLALQFINICTHHKHSKWPSVENAYFWWIGTIRLADDCTKYVRYINYEATIWWRSNIAPQRNHSDDLKTHFSLFTWHIDHSKHCTRFYQLECVPRIWISKRFVLDSWICIKSTWIRASETFRVIKMMTINGLSFKESSNSSRVIRPDARGHSARKIDMSRNETRNWKKMLCISQAIATEIFERIFNGEKNPIAHLENQSIFA